MRSCPQLLVPVARRGVLASCRTQRRPSSGPTSASSTRRRHTPSCPPTSARSSSSTFELLITALEQVHVDGWWPGGVLRTPSFVRCGRRVDEPRVDEASLDLGAVGRVEVPSRRHADSTPAAKVQPVRALPAERTRPEQVAHFRFYHEAVAQLGAVMAQLHDGRASARPVYTGSDTAPPTRASGPPQNPPA